MNRFKMNQEMVYRKIGNECVLVPIGKSVDSVRSVYSLNESGAFILQHLKKGSSIEDIRQQIQQEFDCDSLASEEIGRWIDELISELKTHNILL